ncbi:MAG: hypothetical protein K2K45_03000 [Muribaculaceae bacterium]|nr:hypothetical protein [Muribaculaceae bacterium]
MEFWQISVVVKDKAAVDVRSDVESCFRWCFSEKRETAGGIVHIYRRGLLRCRPNDQGNARSLKQWDGDEYGSRAFFIADLTPWRGDCGRLFFSS